MAIEIVSFRLNMVIFCIYVNVYRTVDGKSWQNMGDYRKLLGKYIAKLIWCTCMVCIYKLDYKYGTVWCVVWYYGWLGNPSVEHGIPLGQTLYQLVISRPSYSMVRYGIDSDRF